MDTNDKHEELKVLEGEKLIENHEYDGIHELDNSPPPWLLGIWWVSLAFAIVFLVYYHLMGGPSQYDRYQTAVTEDSVEIAQFRAAQGPISDLKADLAVGKQLFDKNCVTCHRADAGGNVGPNLTDNYWIHGGKLEDIVLIINEGVIAKGMTPWKGILSEADVQQLAYYIQSLQGSNPPNPKAPEGQPAE